MNLRYVFTPGGPAVVLTDGALLTMQRCRQIKTKDKEAGGQLFAHFDQSDTVIVEATTATQLDHRMRFGFRPHRRSQQNEIYEQYARGLHFVGDWHTHPENVPRPSVEDMSSMIECYRKSAHELRAFIMVIVGIAEVPMSLYVALVDSDDIHPMLLEPS